MILFTGNKLNDLKKVLETVALGVGMAIVLVYCLFRLFQGGDAFIRIHDNLDSNVVYRGIAERSEYFANPNKPLKQLMNGAVSVSVVADRFSVNALLYHFFPTITAYLVNELLVRILAFLGMFLLTKPLLAFPFPLRVSFSVLWALSPVMTFFGLSVVGQPLLLWAFLRIVKENNGGVPWAVLVIYPFWSSLVLAGFFEHVVIGIVFVGLFISDRKLALRLIKPWIVFIVFSCAANADLILRFFVGGLVVSHRSEFISDSINALRAFRAMAKILVAGHSHVMPGLNFILLYGGLGLIASAFLPLQKDAFQLRRVAWVLFAAIIATSLWSGFYEWDRLVFIKDRIPIMKSFQFDRFYFLLPFGCFLLAILVANIMETTGTRVRSASYAALAIVLAAQFGSYALVKNEVASTIKRSVMSTADISSNSPMTANQYLSPVVFKKIKEKIGSPIEEYRVLSVGIAPAVAAGNGMYCLDAYLPEYPLAYKVQFRKIIESELAANEYWRKYFDNWGSRCYVFSSALDRTYYGKDDNLSIEKLSLSRSGIRSIWPGPVFLLSAVPIKDLDNSGLLFQGSFEDQDSPWRIWLYKIAEDKKGL